VAETPEAFEAWRQAQRQPAPPSAAGDADEGRAIVERGACALCHAVRGTMAGAVTAPDMTHLASRQTLASGALPNTPDALTRWIANPQQIKPGVRMPAVPLTPAQLRAVVAYLETLR
jgi:cytochrome c oxidase subunit 2